MGHTKKSKRKNKDDSDSEKSLRRRLVKDINTRRLLERVALLENQVLQGRVSVIPASGGSSEAGSNEANQVPDAPSGGRSYTPPSLPAVPYVNLLPPVPNEIPLAHSGDASSMAHTVAKDPCVANNSREVRSETDVQSASVIVPSLEATTASPPAPHCHHNSHNLCSTSLRYVGRSDPIPEFDPHISLITMEQWIRKVEGISNMYGWDEKTAIFNCSSKLKGYARRWYDQLNDVNLNWLDWKQRLMAAFPSNRSKLTMMRDLVNEVRRPERDYIQFYYDKLALGNACGIPDFLITEAIIGTIGNELVEVGAISAGCRDPISLLNYLSSFRRPASAGVNVNRNKRYSSHYDDQLKCNICKRRGHTANKCNNKSRKQDRTTLVCVFCSKRGHDETNCYIKNKKCSYCGKTGHIKEECLKLKNRRTISNKENDKQ